MSLPDVGFGNQATSVISALLLALLTKRTLLLHWGPGLDHKWEDISAAWELPGASIGPSV